MVDNRLQYLINIYDDLIAQRDILDSIVEKELDEMLTDEQKLKLKRLEEEVEASKIDINEQIGVIEHEIRAFALEYGNTIHMAEVSAVYRQPGVRWSKDLYSVIEADYPELLEYYTPVEASVAFRRKSYKE